MEGGGRRSWFGIDVDVRHLVAGVSGGAVSTVALFPLDFVKTRLQVLSASRKSINPSQPTAYHGMRDAVRKVVAAEGLAAFYQGLSPALVGASASWGLYFFFYENAKKRHDARSAATPLSTGHYMVSAMEAGVATAVLTNPIWLVKVRLQLQNNALAAGARVATPYRGMTDALVRVAREEGVLALYRGIVPALLLVSHGVVQFTVYEELKKLVGKPRKDQTVVETVAMASASKLVATTVTYPYQLLKARLQARGADTLYSGTLDCARKTFAADGPAGFFKGFVPNCLRVVPSSAITFLVYEAVVRAW